MHALNGERKVESDFHFMGLLRNLFAIDLRELIKSSFERLKM